MSRWFENRKFRIAGIIIGAVVVLVAVFYLGVLVGARALRPIGSGPGPLSFLRLGGHGAIGRVTAIQGDQITLTDRNGQSQIISVAKSTLIEVGREHHKQLQDIHVGDNIVVIGAPRANMIQARFIRVDRSIDTPTSTPARTPTATPPGTPFLVPPPGESGNYRVAFFFTKTLMRL